MAERRASPVMLANSLELITRILHRHHGERAVLLIDEYDTPLHAAYAHGYYDHAVEFFRNLLSGGYKDNAHLQKGVLTGILRVAEESIFSGLNNLDVYLPLRSEHAATFGFTEPEVASLAAAAGAEAHLDALRDWYDGYAFGRDQVIYNPSSRPLPPPGKRGQTPVRGEPGLLQRGRASSPGLRLPPRWLARPPRGWRLPRAPARAPVAAPETRSAPHPDHGASS